MSRCARAGYAALVLLLACASAVPLDTSPPGTDPVPTETGGPTGGATTETLPAGEDDGCPTIFDQERLPELRLELSDAAWAGLQADYASGATNFHDAGFSWATETGTELAFPEASVRLRGNPGFSWIGEKMQFLVSFDERDPEGRFLGLRALLLDASWYNPSLLRDRLAYAFFRRLGLPAPCANNARLTLNGSYYGLYTLIERLDQEFLERVYGPDAADGGLWEGGTDLDANAETADAAAMAAFWADPGVAAQEAGTDLAGNLRVWAAEAVVPQNDGYWCCSHNFYLYQHPTAGISFIPWDLDYSFDTAPVAASPDSFYRDNDSQPHLEAVRADPAWRSRWYAALDEANAAFDAELMGAQVEEWAAQTAEAFAEDPHTSVSPGAHDDGVARLGAYVEARQGWLRGWIDCAQGDEADHDGDGFGACLDCDDGDPGIHPGASEGCNRRDDDCDQWTDEDAGCDTCDEVAFDEGRFLVCAELMSWAEADARCVAEGGALGAPVTTGEWYAVVFDTYWQDEAWAGVSSWWAGPGCTTLIPSYWSTSTAACETELPALCRL